MKRQIQKHLGDFIAIIVLVVMSLSVTVYVLPHQRLAFPAWVPGLGKDAYTVKAQFTTGQAVTAGQGQTVTIAGVKVGDVTGVNLQDGKAVVTMRIEKRYAPIYRDATLLLRPKTGLNDMFIELVPGSEEAGSLAPGEVLSSANTNPNVNTDEILASLDGDTRNYLQLLVNAAGQGLRGRGGDLNATLKRLDPTSRDVERIFTAIAERRSNLRRLVHNFQVLTSEVGTRDRQLAQLVDSSNAVFASFASEESALRESLRLLPSTLRASTGAFSKSDRLARELKPTAEQLRPGARALASSQREFRKFTLETEPIVREKLRPFARAARPVVKQLKPAARDLARATPDLTTTFKVLNYALNELAYNPSGSEEGFLFWLAWMSNSSASLFSMQDAQGPLARGLSMMRCPLDTETLKAIAARPDLPNAALLVDSLTLPTC